MTPDNWPPLNVGQRRWRALCALTLPVAVLITLVGVRGIVLHDGRPGFWPGIAAFASGVTLMGAAIFAWPTRWRNRLRQIRDEWREGS